MASSLVAKLLASDEGEQEAGGSSSAAAMARQRRRGRLPTEGGAEAEPLLSHEALCEVFEDQQQQQQPEAACAVAAAAAAAAGGGGSSEASASVGLHFCRGIAQLVQRLRPWSALLLAALSVCEAYVTAQVGVIMGSFYRILIDRQPGQFLAAMGHAACLYVLAAALACTNDGYTEYLALSWRARLTRALHRAYCSQHTDLYCRIALPPVPSPASAGDSAAVAAGTGAAGTGSRRRGGSWGEDFSSAGGSSVGDGTERKGGGGGGGGRPGMDNPDQRITQDVALLCATLGSVAKVVVAVPLKLVYYSFWTYRYTSLVPLLLIYAFFLAGCVLQRLVMVPLARYVYRVERCEGDLRYAHMRLRQYAVEVAMAQGAPAEALHLERRLACLLSASRRLVLQRWLVGGVTRALEYSGSLINYGCIAVPLFVTGAWSSLDGGELAQAISNASFMALTLIYTFTQLLELAATLGTLAGVAPRVLGLLRGLERAAAAQGSAAAAQGAVGGAHGRGGLGGAADGGGAGGFASLAAAWGAGGGGAGGGGDGRRDSMDSWPSEELRGASTQLRRTELAQLLHGPVRSTMAIVGGGAGPCSGDGRDMELSVHALGHGLSADLAHIFPGAPPYCRSPPASPPPPAARGEAGGGSGGNGTAAAAAAAAAAGSGPGGGAAAAGGGGGGGKGQARVYALVTFQRARRGLELATTSLESISPEVIAEMDRLLDRFIAWQQRLREQLLARGAYWCDAADPRTGMALHGEQGDRWSEVTAANLLLGYPKSEEGICPVVMHPRFGRSAYPATVFTDAPLGVILQAVAAAAQATPTTTAAAAAGVSVTTPPAQTLPRAGAADGMPSADPIPRALPPPVHAVLDLVGGSCRDAGGGLVVQALDLRVGAGGRRLLLTGPSGCGKSTLLRALRGLWPLHAAWLVMEPLSGVVFVPQRPFAAPGGTLRQQLQYPFAMVPAAAAVVGHGGVGAGSHGRVDADGGVGAGNDGGSRVGPSAVSFAHASSEQRQGVQRQQGDDGSLSTAADTEDRPGSPLLLLNRQQQQHGGWQGAAALSPTYDDGELVAALDAVGLAGLLRRVRGDLDEEFDWQGGTSVGEQQRLAIARLLLRRPRLAVLDEATSAVGPGAEASIYDLLAAQGISTLSVGQRHSSLQVLHCAGRGDVVVELVGDGGGGWRSFGDGSGSEEEEGEEMQEEEELREEG